MGPKKQAVAKGAKTGKTKAQAAGVKPKEKGKRAAKRKARADAEETERDSNEARPVKKARGRPKKSHASDSAAQAAPAALTLAGKPRKRKLPPGPTLTRTPIPKSYEECGPADRMLLDWRDAGEEWAKIAKQYELLCGVTTDCKSTLPNRYQRMKSYFAMMHDEDAVHLMEAKFRLDKWWEEELWVRLADEVLKVTGTTYTADAVRRNYRRLMEAGNLAVADAKENLDEAHDEPEDE